MELEGWRDNGGGRRNGEWPAGVGWRERGEVEEIEMAGGVDEGGEEGDEDYVLVTKVMGIVRGTRRPYEEGLEAQLRH